MYLVDESDLHHFLVVLSLGVDEAEDGEDEQPQPHIHLESDGEKDKRLEGRCYRKTRERIYTYHLHLECIHLTHLL